MMTLSPLKLMVITLTTTLLLSGCLSLKEKAAIKQAEQQAERQRLKQEEIKSYGPPAIIYRIDDHRYFTLEEYNERKGGRTYYNNTQKGIHQKILNTSACRYQGRLIWASTRDDAIVFPSTKSYRFSNCAGTKYGCINTILVSLDGGKNQMPTNGGFGYTSDAPEYESSRFDIVVINDGFYLGKSNFGRYPNDLLDSPWWQKFYFDPTDSNYVHSSSGARETPSLQLKTPSGQTRMDCSDPAIFDVSK